MRVFITHATGVGWVNYDSDTKELYVDFPDENTKIIIENFLTKKRKFIIPIAHDYEDQTREDFVEPTESQMYLELALCTMHANIDVWVNWQKSKD